MPLVRLLASDNVGGARLVNGARLAEPMSMSVRNSVPRRGMLRLITMCRIGMVCMVAVFEVAGRAPAFARHMQDRHRVSGP